MISTKSKRVGGWGHWFNGNGPDLEQDTVTCAHCNRVVFITPLKPVEDETGWCMACFKFICLACAAKRECVPLERQLARMERGR